MAGDDPMSMLRDELSRIAEELGDLAIDRLKSALDAGDDEAEATARLERRITRARRAVEKAVVLLSGPPEATGDEI